MKMPFGQHRDVELDQVPRPYLQWLRRQEWLGAWLRQAIDDVLTGGELQPEATFEEIIPPSVPRRTTPLARPR